MPRSRPLPTAAKAAAIWKRGTTMVGTFPDDFKDGTPVAGGETPAL